MQKETDTETEKVFNYLWFYEVWHRTEAKDSLEYYIHMYIILLKDLSFDMVQDCGEKRFAESPEKVWLTWPPNYKTFFSLL